MRRRSREWRALGAPKAKQGAKARATLIWLAEAWHTGAKAHRMQALHIINLDTRDNHEEAVSAAIVTCQLAAMVSRRENIRTC